MSGDEFPYSTPEYSWSMLNKLKFYQAKNIKIRFRLIARPEYFYEGNIQLIETNDDEAVDYILIQLHNKEMLYLNLRDISESSLHPASINPIQYFERGFISDEKRRIVNERCHGLCELNLVGCTEKYEEVDHWIPSSRGGSEDLSNLRGACSHCNKKKSDRLWEEIPQEEKLYGR
jgi:hypothetical protein